MSQTVARTAEPGTSLDVNTRDSAIGVRHRSQQLFEVLRPLIESPQFPILKKMGKSKGVLRNAEDSDRVMFIPEAVIEYGFAHLPSKEDPEGRQFQCLPSIPNADLRDFGSYLFLRAGSTIPASRLLPELDPAFLEAQRVYEESDRNGIPPARVLRVLLMETGIDQFWVEVDPAEDMDAQLAEFKRWLGRIERSLYGRVGKKRYPKREAPRDTLIYTLKESTDLGYREIAERAFAELFPLQICDSLVARVAQSLSTTRHALRQAGLPSPSRKRTPSG